MRASTSWNRSSTAFSLAWGKCMAAGYGAGAGRGKAGGYSKAAKP